MEEEKPTTKEKVTHWLAKLTSSETIIYMLAGTVVILVGLTSLNGGGIGLKATTESEISWLEFGDLPRWALWAFVVFGIDIAIFRGKAIEFLIGKLPLPKTGLRDKYIKKEKPVTEEETTNADSKRNQLGDKQYQILQQQDKRTR